MGMIKRLWDEKPLSLILFLAFFVRLCSVIFSKGYGMHDDHFLVIEASKSWVDGFDYNNWLPKAGSSEQHPSGHSFFYVGLHYFLFHMLEFITISDPQSQMYVVRLLHALLSLITVFCGYKIAFKLAGEQQAKMVGLLLAVFWFMPFLSVRNLVELVCIVPLVAATWVVIKNEEENKIAPYVFAGILLGLAFSVRFQTILFTGGFGLALLFSKRIKEAIVLGILFLIVAVGIQGVADYYIWGKPFVEFQEYVRYNIENATSYYDRPWHLYLLFISGILIPPVSLFLLFGFFKNWKKHLLLFLPSFAFLLFHSYFPNKQERFIFPIIPFIIISGYMGWQEFVNNSNYWENHKALLKRFWIFFWTLNCIALSVVSFAYSKRNRVEALVYLSHQSDYQNVVIEDSNRDGYTMPPMFYLDKWSYVYKVTKKISVADLHADFSRLKPEKRANYVLFMQEENLEQRIASFTEYFPTLTYEATIEPSFIDKLMHWLNPVNKNQTTFIYKIK